MIKDVINYLNTKLSTLGYFNNVICLAERIEREGRVYPAQYATNGEYAEINLDVLGSTCYWRKNGDVSISEEDNTGGIGIQYKTTIPLKFVGFIKKETSDDQYFADNLIAGIIGNLTVSNSALKTALKAKTVRIVADKYVTDRIAVGKEEYNNIEFEANYQYAYFSVDFSLMFVTNNQCYTDICNDLPIEFGYVTVTDNGTVTQVKCGNTYTCTGASASGTYEIYVNGVLNQSGSSADLTIETFNISA